jgi:pimeloyl-ACP methyl ester carboxylesterase
MKIVTFVVAALAALGACAALPADRPATRTISPAAMPTRGGLVGMQRLETMDQAALQAIARELPGAVQVRTGAQLYKLSYWTELQGQLVMASGLVSVPSGDGPLKGVVLYAHGTTMTRALSPSQPHRADGNEETAVFAGNGYLVVLPDYVGLGESTLPQAYAIVRPQVDASTDMLRAVRQWANREGLRTAPSLMLMGFSQGGQTVAGLQRELERVPLEGYRLRGTVAIAGPHDLRSLSVRKSNAPDALELENVGYLAFALSAYADYYGASLETVTAGDYARLLPALFDGSKSLGEIAQQLPPDARLLFQPLFLRALQSNTDTWFTRALDENETYTWIPRAPIWIVYGDADTDVPSASSRALYDYAAPRGGAVTLHPMGPVDHMTAAALSYAPALAWFDALVGADVN